MTDEKIKRQLDFFVEGSAIPKQSFRALLTKKDGKASVRGYRDPRVTAWQETVGIIAKGARNRDREGKQFDGFVGVMLEFHLATARRVDLDNLSKCILDALNNVMWKDDSCVVDLHIIKIVKSATPGVRITIWDIPELQKSYYLQSKGKGKK